MWNDRAVMAHKDETRSAGCVPVVELLGNDRDGQVVGLDLAERKKMATDYYPPGYLPREAVTGKLTLGYAESFPGGGSMQFEAGGAAPPIIVDRNQVEASDEPGRLARAAQIEKLIKARCQISDSIRAINREVADLKVGILREIRILNEAAATINLVCRSLTGEAL